jgi:hypothetical protein
MKKRLLGLSVVGSAALVLVGVFGVGLPGASAQNNETLSFQEQAVNVTYVPVQSLSGAGSTAPPGDYVVFEDPLVNAKGQTVGYNEGECFVTDAAKGILECPGVTFVFTGDHGFPKGSIQGAGIFIAPASGPGPKNPDPFLYGTGAFAGAEGTLTGSQVSSTLDDWTLSFTR